MTKRARAAGFSLLEVVIALSVLAIAGLGLVELVAQAIRSGHHALTLERVTTDQDRLLAAWTLLDRRDLESRAGSHVVGPYVVRVTRLDWSLYRIDVGAIQSVPDLTTVVYRPGPDGADQ